jgi:phosphonopyruvate decarboxylase
MIDGDRVLDGFRARGVSLVTGVPCSYLNGVIGAAIADPDVHYLVATSEGEAVGIAIGTWLGGGSPLVLSQNSGLGNMVNPLSSLAHPCRTPFPILVSWRGHPDAPDEPQHELMGVIAPRLLALLGLESAVLPRREAELEGLVERAYETMAREQLPFCVLVEPGSIRQAPVGEPEPRPRLRGRLFRLDGERTLTRVEALERVLALAEDDAAIVATTGKTGRELWTLADRRQHFYQVGAMGCASAVGLGVALRTAKRVVVLDGDGAALMKLGNMATVGAAAPPNLVHVLLDNGVHDSTGGQRTSAATVSFADVAIGCGYRSAVSCAQARDFEDALASSGDEDGPHLVHVRIKAGSLEPLGRPEMHPTEFARRFREFVAEAPVAAAAGARA